MRGMNQPSKTPLPATAPDDPFFAGIARGVPFARIYTAQNAPILPAVLADALDGRGFVPGFTDPDNTTAPLNESGLADAVFTVGDLGYRIISLSSSRGNGCRIAVRETSAEELPDDYMARRSVPKPKLLYLLMAGGASNSDRNLCENIAEAVMLLTDGLVEIGGRGSKSGNRPELYDSFWLGSIRPDKER